MSLIGEFQYLVRKFKFQVWLSWFPSSELHEEISEIQKKNTPHPRPKHMHTHATPHHSSECGSKFGSSE